MNINPDIRQRHLEAFFRLMRENNIEPNDLSVPEYSGGVVRMAIKAELLEGLGLIVDELKPSEVRKLSRDINTAIAGALKIPPA